MPKILIVPHDHRKHCAFGRGDRGGARSVTFTEVDVRRLEPLREESGEGSIPTGAAAGDRVLEGVERLAECDGLVLGAPTRHGGMSAELKALLDRTGEW